MQTEQPTSTDTTPIRLTAAYILNWGFRVSAALLALGLLVSLARGEDLASEATSYGDLLPDLLDGKGTALVSLAILAIMASPVLTVLAVAIGFLRMHDRRYGRISLVVLVVLALSIVSSLLR